MAEAAHALAGAHAGKTPVWFWIVAIAALLWNLMGVVDYVMTQYQVESYMASFTPEQRAYFDGFASWYVALWALTVFSATGGCIGLLLRKRWAEPVFGFSLILYVIGSIYAYGFTQAYAMTGLFGAVFSLVIGLSLLALLWFARWTGQKGILR